MGGRRRRKLYSRMAKAAKSIGQNRDIELYGFVHALAVFVVLAFGGGARADDAAPSVFRAVPPIDVAIGSPFSGPLDPDNSPAPQFARTASIGSNPIVEAVEFTTVSTALNGNTVDAFKSALEQRNTVGTESTAASQRKPSLKTDEPNNEKFHTLTRHRRPTTNVDVTFSRGLDVGAAPFRFSPPPSDRRESRPSRCQYADDEFWPSATLCDDALGADACRDVFGDGNVKTRPVLCDDPGLEELSRACAQTCKICCEAPKYDCVDSAGLIDCFRHRSKCEDARWRPVMAVACERTCGLCDADRCFDAAPPPVADGCLAMRPLCHRRAFRHIMRANCALTCGFCTSGTSKSLAEALDTRRDEDEHKDSVQQKCADRLPNCAKQKRLCTKKRYGKLMAAKCAKTCGYCDSDEDLDSNESRKHDEDDLAIKRVVLARLRRLKLNNLGNARRNYFSPSGPNDSRTESDEPGLTWSGELIDNPNFPLKSEYHRIAEPTLNLSRESQRSSSELRNESVGERSAESSVERQQSRPPTRRDAKRINPDILRNFPRRKRRPNNHTRPHGRPKDDGFDSQEVAFIEELRAANRNSRKTSEKRAKHSEETDLYEIFAEELGRLIGSHNKRINERGKRIRQSKNTAGGSSSSSSEEYLADEQLKNETLTLANKLNSRIAEDPQQNDSSNSAEELKRHLPSKNGRLHFKNSTNSLQPLSSTKHAPQQRTDDRKLERLLQKFLGRVRENNTTTTVIKTTTTTTTTVPTTTNLPTDSSSNSSEGGEDDDGETDFSRPDEEPKGSEGGQTNEQNPKATNKTISISRPNRSNETLETNKSNNEDESAERRKRGKRIRKARQLLRHRVRVQNERRDTVHEISRQIRNLFAGDGLLRRKRDAEPHENFGRSRDDHRDKDNRGDDTQNVQTFSQLRKLLRHRQSNDLDKFEIENRHDFDASKSRRQKRSAEQDQQQQQHKQQSVQQQISPDIPRDLPDSIYRQEPIETLQSGSSAPAIATLPVKSLNTSDDLSVIGYAASPNAPIIHRQASDVDQFEAEDLTDDQNQSPNFNADAIPFGFTSAPADVYPTDGFGSSSGVRGYGGSNSGEINVGYTSDNPTYSLGNGSIDSPNGFVDDNTETLLSGLGPSEIVDGTEAGGNQYAQAPDVGLYDDDSDLEEDFDAVEDSSDPLDKYLQRYASFEPGDSSESYEDFLAAAGARPSIRNGGRDALLDDLDEAFGDRRSRRRKFDGVLRDKLGVRFDKSELDIKQAIHQIEKEYEMPKVKKSSKDKKKNVEKTKKLKKPKTDTSSDDKKSSTSGSSSAESSEPTEKPNKSTASAILSREREITKELKEILEDLKKLKRSHYRGTDDRDNDDLRDYLRQQRRRETIRTKRPAAKKLVLLPNSQDDIEDDPDDIDLIDDELSAELEPVEPRRRRVEPLSSARRRRLLVVQNRRPTATVYRQPPRYVLDRTPVAAAVPPPSTRRLVLREYNPSAVGASSATIVRTAPTASSATIVSEPLAFGPRSPPTNFFEAPPSGVVVAPSSVGSAGSNSLTSSGGFTHVDVGAGFGPIPPELCKDYYPYCEQITPTGFCASTFYPLKMKREFCPQSCGLC